MKIQVLRSGKIHRPDFFSTILDYRKRIGSYAKTDDIELKIDSNRDKRTSHKNSDPIYTPSVNEQLVLLDERGRSLNSIEIAKSLQSWMDDPRVKTVSFLIGPPYGFDDATRRVAHETWSLSSMTVPSHFAWLLIWEQIYRAFTILKDLPYHHD